MTAYSEALRRVRLAGFCLALAGTSFSNSVVAVGTGVYAAGLVLALLHRGQALPALPFPWVLTAAVISLTYSFHISGYPGESLRGVWKYVCSLVIFYAGYESIRSSRTLTGVAAGFIAVSGLAAASGVGQDLWGRDFILGREPVLFTDSVTRITGPFNHCNDFASFLIPGLLLLAAASVTGFKDRKRWAPAALALLVLFGWALARTMSRAAFIGAGAGLVVLVFFMPYRRAIVGTLIAASLCAWLIPSDISHRLHSLLDLQVDMRERLLLIQGTLKMVQDAPWFGLGLNTYSKLYPIYNPPDPAAPVLMYAHNSYLQLMAESGLMGVATYLAYVSSGLRRMHHLSGDPDDRSVRWIRAALLAAAAGLLVNALFESLLQSTQLRTLFWSLLGMGLSAQRSARPAPAAARVR